MARIVVGLSGGVDSAVTAYLLKQQGHTVTGIFMKNWEGDDDDPNCPTRQDFLDVLAIGDALDIEVDLVNFAAEYKERVFAYFLAEYHAGRTPNPDVLCNAEIKFKAFLDHAIDLGADHIATGHYAQLTGEMPQRQLRKAVDANKDQSYFLYRLTQAQIAPALFPLGAMTKPEVRALAREIALPVAHKKDSTGICFIGERDFRDFLKRYLPVTPGAMRTPEGRVVGRHEGLSYYTLGQRQGLGIGGVKGAAEGVPWFVAGKVMAENALIVVQGHEHPLLLNRTLTASALNWIGAAPEVGRHYTAKTRYRQVDAPCQVTHCDDNTVALYFDAPQWAVTPGQSVVLYDGEVCLGGGVIC
ncbi:MAG: tRNA 2-thiouridine(34) synthase MnmA [Betaproteobacteria bacterium]|nr:MAG: tRNA 2-thiouridine(34) synthase MnmA [Betaproteobacteria bacterium]